MTSVLLSSLIRMVRTTHFMPVVSLFITRPFSPSSAHTAACSVPLSLNFILGIPTKLQRGGASAFELAECIAAAVSICFVFYDGHYLHGAGLHLNLPSSVLLLASSPLSRTVCRSGLALPKTDCFLSIPMTAISFSRSMVSW